ncbi:hypothetical protein Bpfe_028724 [Biomphalaria pfeifferi]|uniref:Uncharacterized protein n=1 Tax=Biomphalaria pfeifferi TaxID=112525 RepID=A0AAD8ASZ2_BIOPF|nr:hypothetical protein Bpfe_028724 [Biomphalaria pfeifferi]
MEISSRMLKPINRTRKYLKSSTTSIRVSRPKLNLDKKPKLEKIKSVDKEKEIPEGEEVTSSSPEKGRCLSYLCCEDLSFFSQATLSTATLSTATISTATISTATISTATLSTATLSTATISTATIVWSFFSDNSSKVTVVKPSSF